MPPNFESNYRMSDVEIGQLLRPQVDANGQNSSRVARFYDGRSVFVTGATGFVGRLLVEKLLRACTNIKRVYILVRAKRGKSARDRVRDLTQSIVFDGLRSMNIKFEEKLVPLEGDLTRDYYGFTKEQLDILINDKVSCIFHSAASVNFQEPLRDASLTNVVGAMNAIQLGKMLPDLAALVYISTAYSNCIKKPDICERVYPSDIDPSALIDMTKKFNRDAMEVAKKGMMGSYPNTYTFTKNLAENLCLNHSQDLPIVICRPSVVISTWQEPIPGFVDNINGGNGINYSPATGLSVVMQADNNIVLDYVPVDVVVNCVIASGWFCSGYHSIREPKKYQSKGYFDQLIQENQKYLINKFEEFYQRFRRHLKVCQLPERLANVPVFHATSGVENPIKMGEFKDKMVAYANEYPTLQLIREPRMTYHRSWYLFELNRLIQNKFIAKMMDVLQRLPCLRPEIYDESDAIVKKKLSFRVDRLDHFTQTIAYFLIRHWNFSPNNRHLLIDEFMTQEDRNLFGCDMRQLDWDKYCKIYALGIRKFLLKEPIETLERARSRLAYVNFRNTTLQMIMMISMIYLILIFV